MDIADTLNKASAMSTSSRASTDRAQTIAEVSVPLRSKHLTRSRVPQPDSECKRRRQVARRFPLGQRGDACPAALDQDGRDAAPCLLRVPSAANYQGINHGG